MSAETRLHLTPNLVVGICLIFVGGALALDRMYLVDASRVLRFWPIGLVLFGVSLIMQTLRGGGEGSAAAGDMRGRFHGGHILGLVLIAILVTQTLRGKYAERRAASATVSLLGVMVKTAASAPAPFACDRPA